MILVAPTSYKGTHSASAAAAALAAGVRSVYSGEVLQRPVSDGGPGLIESLQYARGGALHRVDVRGPLGEPVHARVLVQDSLAIVESADACGLHLVPEEQRNPLYATTFGVGQLILAAASYASQVIVGLGGSATVDGGVGAARALGWQLRGESLLDFTSVERRPDLLPIVTALADVRSPLYGPEGAAFVFGPQKGASVPDVAVLDAALARLAHVIRRDLGIDVTAIPGAGAAGGLGAGLRAFADAPLLSGSDWVLERIGIDQLLPRASAVVTGEGRYDLQSGLGKVTGTLRARAEALGIPCLIIAGEEGETHLNLDDLSRRVSERLPQLLSA